MAWEGRGGGGLLGWGGGWGGDVAGWGTWVGEGRACLVLSKGTIQTEPVMSPRIAEMKRTCRPPRHTDPRTSLPLPHGAAASASMPPCILRAATPPRRGVGR